MRPRAKGVLLGLLVAVAACGGGATTPPPKPAPPPPPVASPPDAGAREATSESRFDPVSFRTAVDEAVEAMFVADPVEATEDGDHRFDDRWPDVSAAGEAKIAADFRVRAQGLRTIAESAPEHASPAEAGTDRPALDARVVADRLDAIALRMTALRTAERHPSAILRKIGEGITSLTVHPFASKHTRMNALSTRLAAIPDLLKTARGRVASPEHASMEELPIVGEGLVQVLRGELAHVDAVSVDGDAPLAERTKKGALAAAVAIEAYVNELKKTFPAPHADVPIGAELWGRLALLGEGVSEDPATVRRMGEAELARLEKELDALIARSGKPGETRRAFFKRLEQETVPRGDVLAEYTRTVTALEAWMKSHPFVTVPWDRVKITVVRSPPEMRGMSLASMNPAGPLEPSATDADFEVNTPDASMPEGQRRALAAFHAPGAIDLVAIHEAIPGHYLQHLANRENASRARKIIWASTTGEGWAHYCEQAVLDAGYTGKDPVRTRAFYLRMALQRATRVLVDVGENDGSLTPDAGAKLLEDRAFLAPAAAHIEARRAVLAPANMFTYTYGKLKILEARREVEAREGKAFDLVRFHDQLLKLGSIPVRYVTREVTKSTP